MVLSIIEFILKAFAIIILWIVYPILAFYDLTSSLRKKLFKNKK